MKRMFSVVLALMFLCLAVGVVNANVTPVEVERVKDICFVRVRGAHHLPPDPEEKLDSGFLFYYKNIEPNGEIHSPQDVKLWFHIYLGDQHDLPLTIWFYDVCPSDVIDSIVCRRSYGHHMEFEVSVWKAGIQLVLIHDTVFIPPA